MLYKIRGLVNGEINWHWNAELNKEEEKYTQIKEIYYLEASNIEKALTKAKKIFNYVHEIAQVNGQIYKEGKRR
jgi:hypothetical protein